jgi:hypothetical protein
MQTTTALGIPGTFSALFLKFLTVRSPLLRLRRTGFLLPTTAQDSMMNIVYLLK